MKKRIYIIEDLCNGCRLCQTFCSSLEEGVFSEHGRIRVLKPPGEERDIPLVDCNGVCLRPIYDERTPTCVSVCPTGALFYATQDEAMSMRLAWEQARQAHGLFKVIAPWKWPLPWRQPSPETADLAPGDA
jgi:Fe-S-cluster-containing dehydrogenase component